MARSFTPKPWWATSRAWLLALATFIVVTPALAQSTGWTSAFQPTVRGDGGMNVAVDAHHNQYVTGHFRDSVRFGTTVLRNTGWFSTFVAKRDSAGHWLWATAMQDRARGDAFGLDIAVDGTGDVYISGYYDGDTLRAGASTLLPGGRRNSGFVASLTPNGQWRWATAARCLTDTHGTVVIQLAVNDAAVYVTGYYGDSTLLGGQLLTSPLGGRDAFVAALDKASGQWQWVQTGGGTREDYGFGITTDAVGNVYAVGSYTGAATFNGQGFSNAGYGDIWVGSLTAAGQWRWIRTAGGADQEAAYSVAIDPVTAEVAVVGYFGGSVSFGAAGTVQARGVRDGFLALLDTLGNWRRVSQIGGLGAEVFCWDAAWAPDGHELLVVGDYTQTVAFGTTSATNSPVLTSNGLSNGFLARWAGGTTEWADVLSAGGGVYENIYAIVTERIDGRLQGVAAGGISSPTVAFGPDTLVTVSLQDNGAPFARLPFIATAVFNPLPLSTAAEKASASFALYPNPTRATVRITLAAATDQPLTIYDAWGRAVQRQILAPAQTEAVLDLRSLPAGLYVVRCGGAAQRLVVE